MTFGELDLKKVREDCGLDFAHFTYKKGMCSCCYGPRDLPSIYWHNREIMKDDYTYILFKNADNGSGVVTKNDDVCPGGRFGGYRTECIEWDFPMEWLPKVCKALQDQLTSEYKVVIPDNAYTCILIKRGE